MTADSSSGDWTATETISVSTTFIAKSLGAHPSTSSQITVTIKPLVVVIPDPKNFKPSAKVLGMGRVTITAVGNGDTRSVVTIYQVVGKKLVKVTSVKVNAKGVASATIKTSKGSKTYKIVYINGPKSAAKTITVRVK